MSNLHSRLVRRIVQVAFLAGAPALAGSAGAQMPGLPVLQNAWANPGITLAANAGTGGGSKALAAAAAWAPRSGRFQLSGGIGVRDGDDAGQGLTLGARAALPVWSFASGAVGIAGFIGIGSARLPDVVFAGEGEGGSLIQVPIGAAIGYRRAFSFIRGVSVYGTPFYSFNRLTVGDSSSSDGAFRLGFGADVGLTSRIGVTVGAEFGGGASEDETGPGGTVFGIGASFALGRRE